MDAATDPLHVLQITDPHLLGDPDGRLLGMNTRRTLDAVLSHVRAHYGQPDLVLATGDISQDGSDASYQHFQERTAFFEGPVFWFAGNHDVLAAMSRTIAGTRSAERRYRGRGWQLIFLDSSVPEQVHGHLGEQELAYLEACLREYPNDHALVCLHHHPVRIGAEWMNTIGLQDHEALFEVLARHSQVRGLLCGHIHQSLDQQANGWRMLASPSTCFQFLPDSESFAVDSAPPGYRWLVLYPDGRIRSGVERIADKDYGLEIDSIGY
ncbi:3',5'-cyclic-AMP phosphodiesterase [Halomonadaceae bacterium KBTZ08]